jgi:hypothetical protein
MCKKVAVYLSGKITGLSLEEMTAWRIYATNKLTAAGFIVIDPTQTAIDFTSDDKEIVTSNLYQVGKSSIVLAELHHEEYSKGTGFEIVDQGKQGKPVIVWGNSFIIQQYPWISYYTTRTFNHNHDTNGRFPGLDAAIGYIIANYSIHQQ